LRTDNRSEFKNLKILNFCKSNGIINEFSGYYESQQNRKIECFYGFFLISAWGILDDLHLNKVFWEDTIDTANWIHNEITHKDNNNKTYYDLIYYKNINYNKYLSF